jgi:site-specific DNA-cytosine methylase
VSALNNAASSESNRSTIESGVGFTGQCFKALLGYAEGVRPRGLLFENVFGLKPVLDESLFRLYNAGYSTRVFETSSIHFGLPQDRPRLWIVCVLTEAVSHMTHEQILDMLGAQM